MEILKVFALIGFYGTLIVTLGAAVLVVTLRNIFHSALSLVLTLLGVAVIYLYLGAEFLAMVQVLLYIGAIMTLLIFAIMLTHHIGDKTVPQANRQSLPAFALLSLLNVLFLWAVTAAAWKVLPETANATIDAKALGTALMGAYVFPFEIVSVVLIIALVGAIILGRRDA